MIRIGELPNLFSSFGDVTRQRWLRVRVAVAAYAYEVQSTPIISDAEFDALAAEIDPTISTIDWWHDLATVERYRKLDRFFATEFSPHTGQWIFSHPEFDLIVDTWQRIWDKEPSNKETQT